MSKKINEIIKNFPKSETVCLTFIKGTKKYKVTRDRDKTYYLYEETENGYIFLKSRKRDPCFPECY